MRIFVSFVYQTNSIIYSKEELEESMNNYLQDNRYSVSNTTHPEMIGGTNVKNNIFGSGIIVTDSLPSTNADLKEITESISECLKDVPNDHIIILNYHEVSTPDKPKRNDIWGKIKAVIRPWINESTDRSYL